MENVYSCSIRSNRSVVPSHYPEWVTWIAFGAGLTGAISLGLILVAKAYHPELIRLCWYVGICGNMLFSLFRSFITQRRRRLITELGLLEKLQEEDSLCPDDYKALRYLVSSLHASKERWNCTVIFVCSVAAITWDLWPNTG
jgi:hypothetical protein